MFHAVFERSTALLLIDLLVVLFWGLVEFFHMRFNAYCFYIF